MGCEREMQNLSSKGLQGQEAELLGESLVPVHGGNPYSSDKNEENAETMQQSFWKAHWNGLESKRKIWSCWIMMTPERFNWPERFML